MRIARYDVRMSDARAELPPLPDGLTRVTVNLIPRAAQALDHLAALTGDTKTDTINRAIQFYAALEGEMRQGKGLYVATPGEIRKGTLTEIKVV